MDVNDLVLNGYVDLGEFHPEATTLEAAQIIASEFNIQIDSDVESLTTSSIGTKPRNTYGGNFGHGALPLHTDLAHWHIPPRYFLLRCVVADPQVFTLLLHSREVVNALPAAVVDRAVFRPRRSLDGKMYFLRLRAGGIFRWDQLFLTPENIEAEQVRNFLTNQYQPFTPLRMALDVPSKTLLIDNWNILHARTSVELTTSPRCIDRVYFSKD
jgi:L-asparagine oxygenase